MTTVIGILAKKGKPGVVLTSDYTATQSQERKEGDVTYRTEVTSTIQKLYTNPKKHYSYGVAGCVTPNLRKFHKELKEVKPSELETLLNSGKFKRFGDMNLALGIAEGNYKTFNSGLANTSLILATNFKRNPELWEVYSMGAVEKKELAVIGSGSPFVEEYVNLLIQNRRNSLDLEGLSISEAIDLASNCMSVANNDIHTKGFDLVVVDQAGIKHYGPKMDKTMARTRQSLLSKIKERYN